VELRSFRYFLAVTEAGSFRRAAARLMITQPPLSREMRRLERELGVDLFDRSARPVTLTRAGRAFVTDARAVLAQVDAAVENARTAADPRDHLRVGFLGAAANGLLPRAVREFRQLHPDVALVLEEHESGLAQFAALRDGRIDLGLVREPSDEHGLDSRTILDEPFVLILPSDHRLAGTSAPVSLHDLTGEPFVFWSRASAPSPFDTAIQTFSRMGLEMPIVQEALGVQTILGLVAAGIGVSLLPESVTTLHREGVVSRPLQSPGPTIPLCAVWRTDGRTNTLADFLAALDRSLPTPAGRCQSAGVL
jgi:DNA-binding transcriptional LysR family regulator